MTIFRAKTVKDDKNSFDHQTREGVIIECPIIHLFHDACDIILTSRNGVRQLDDDDDEPTLGI